MFAKYFTLSINPILPVCVQEEDGKFPQKLQNSGSHVPATAGNAAFPRSTIV